MHWHSSLEVDGVMDWNVKHQLEAVRGRVDRDGNGVGVGKDEKDEMDEDEGEDEGDRDESRWSARAQNDWNWNAMKDVVDGKDERDEGTVRVMSGDSFR